VIEFKNEIYDLKSSADRYLLHQELDKAWETEFSPLWDYVEEDQETLEEELQKAHILISAQDEKGLEEHSIGFSYELGFGVVQNDEMLVEALKETGYKFEKSAASRSVYVTNKNGKEVRIADHKRPAYEVGGVFYDHEYDYEIITENNIVSKKQLEQVGIVLTGEKYYLG
jgi:thermostable 8-oxoguanine DNA glycosylase